MGHLINAEEARRHEAWLYENIPLVTSQGIQDLTPPGIKELIERFKEQLGGLGEHFQTFLDTHPLFPPTPDE